MHGLNKSAAMRHSLIGYQGVYVGYSNRRKPSEPGGPQRAFAGDFPPDRRKLSCHWRAGGLAQPGASLTDHTVASFGAQRHVGPRAAGADLRTAYLGRTVADRTGPTLLRRRADAGRRLERERSPLARGAVGSGRPRQVAGKRAHRSPADPVGLDAFSRRRGHRAVQRAAYAPRIRTARA